MKTQPWFVLVLGGLLLMFGAWASASPLGSSADEDFHLSSIWCGAGESTGCLPSIVDGRVLYEVPSVIGAESCYLRGYTEASLESAACLNDPAHIDDFVLTFRVNNIAGYYPPVFYRSMHSLVGGDPTRSVLTMRLANSF